MQDTGFAAGQGFAETGQAPVYDPDMLAELQDLFGYPRLMQLLSLLKAEIRQRLLVHDDRAALGQDAHALLSSSGSLGFTDLSRRCSEVERACLAGADLAAPVLEARAAARVAIAAINLLEAAA